MKLIYHESGNSNSTYEMKFPSSKITNYLQVSNLLYPSVTWRPNAYCSPIKLKLTSDSQTGKADFENHVWKCWIFISWQETSKNDNSTKKFQLCLLWNSKKIGST